MAIYDGWKWYVMMLDGGKSGRLQVISVLNEIWKIGVSWFFILSENFGPR